MSRTSGTTGSSKNTAEMLRKACRNARFSNVILRFYLFKKLRIFCVQKLRKQLEFIDIKMPLTDFDLGKGASCNITAMGLQSGGKLFLREPSFLPCFSNFCPYDFFIFCVHAAHPAAYCAQIRTLDNIVAEGYNQFALI